MVTSTLLRMVREPAVFMMTNVSQHTFLSLYHTPEIAHLPKFESFFTFSYMSLKSINTLK